jgi:hypothetical protein
MGEEVGAGAKGDSGRWLGLHARAREIVRSTGSANFGAPKEALWRACVKSFRARANLVRLLEGGNGGACFILAVNFNANAL